MVSKLWVFLDEADEPGLSTVAAAHPVPIDEQRLQRFHCSYTEAVKTGQLSEEVAFKACMRGFARRTARDAIAQYLLTETDA